MCCTVTLTKYQIVLIQYLAARIEAFDIMVCSFFCAGIVGEERKVFSLSKEEEEGQHKSS